MPKGVDAMNRRHVRIRLWFEVGLAVASAGLFIVTLFWHDWVELIFHVDPDEGSGLLEVGLTLATALVSLLFAMTARAEWRGSLKSEHA
jgi:hypothetical protein